MDTLDKLQTRQDVEANSVTNGIATSDTNAIERTKTAEYASSFSLMHKSFIVLMTSWTTLSATFSSTSIFSLTEEIATDMDLSSEMLLATNGMVLFVMGCSSFIWVPVGRIMGCRFSWNLAIIVLSLTTLATALAPTASTFIIFRILSALQGTYFHVAGQTILADIFEPVYRGTATGFFTAGTVLGPPLGPCVAGIMVTYTQWRNVFWLQFAMMGSCSVLSLIFLPNIRKSETRLSGDQTTISTICRHFNLLRVFKPMLKSEVILPQLTCGFLSWSQYSLLAGPRHIINPQFNLTAPLVSGLFYLAPGSGFLLGTLIGGKFSDMTVVKWIAERGFRLPQDRLRSGLSLLFVVVPSSAMVYGWGLQTKVGGLVLPIISAFFWGLGLLATFASLNTYCAEVLPQQRSEVIAGKYFIQYSFSAAGSAAIIPLMDTIGVGLATSIGVIFVFTGGVFTLLVAKREPKTALRDKRHHQKGVLIAN